MNTNMIEEFKIEKNVPMPTKHPGNPMGSGAKWVRLISSMEIGDSVLVLKPPMPTIYAGCRRRGWKVRIQKQAEPGLMRIWRVQ